MYLMDVYWGFKKSERHDQYHIDGNKGKEVGCFGKIQDEEQVSMFFANFK